jgi:hypothetical protein
MYRQQPLDQLPAPDDDLRGAWLNKETVLGQDFSPAGDDLTPVNVDDVKFLDVGADFGGTNGYLRRAEADWRPDDQGTVLAWVKTSAIGTRQYFFSSSDEGSVAHYWGIFIESTGELGIVSNESGSVNAVESVAQLTAGEWARVAAVSIGTAWILYINGSRQESVVTNGSNAGVWLADITLRDNVMVSGALTSGGLSGPFNGQIKDPRYYSRALSAAEIAADYALGVPDDDLRLWLPGERDYSRFVRSLTLSGGVIPGMWTEYDGVDGKIDCGDLGNIQQFSTIINPATTSEQIVQLDTNKHITIASGTVTYTGLTAVDTFVDGVRSATLEANRRQFLVCQFSEVDANNFELGWDGTNYGQIHLRDTKARAGVWTANRVAKIEDEIRRFI